MSDQPDVVYEGYAGLEPPPRPAGQEQQLAEWFRNMPPGAFQWLREREHEVWERSYACALDLAIEAARIAGADAEVCVAIKQLGTRERVRREAEQLLREQLESGE